MAFNNNNIINEKVNGGFVCDSTKVLVALRGTHEDGKKLLEAIQSGNSGNKVIYFGKIIVDTRGVITDWNAVLDNFTKQNTEQKKSTEPQNNNK